ncbi:hypothetical protein [Pseudomonas sp. GZD-222]|uniref:hypothetical protein n=1 Tax=Pseudomonas sp. GZD-222 TaxID=3404805 RepID=UPI003BB5E39C
MRVCKRSIPFLLLVLLLTACSQVRDISSLSTAEQQTGAQTAQVLNFRLTRTVAECPGDNPLFACSGVLVRDVAAGNPATFWRLGAGAQQDFLLLRDDAPQAKPAGKVGFVFQDRFSAIAQGKPYTGRQTEGGWQVAIDNWNDQAPAGVAIEAVYYDFADPKALLRAHNAQRAFFNVTGEWLPVLRYARTEAGQVRFGFNQMEQLYYGYTVAARLNARFAETTPSCPDGTPPFHCSGLLVRSTDVGNFHAWNPSPSSIRGNGVSFSWFRADQQARKTFKGQGFVMAPMSAPVAHPLTLRCIYPFDAASSTATDMCTFRGLCTPNSNTLATWMTAYRTRPTSSCAIDPDVQGVQLLTDIRNDSRVRDPYGWNEWLITPWPQNIGRQLPLEAFFHTRTSQEGGNGVPGAQTFQRDYLNTDERYLPVLELIPLAAEGQVFTYLPSEQSVD